jgi:predicted peroxiredoxin
MSDTSNMIHNITEKFSEWKEEEIRKMFERNGVEACCYSDNIEEYHKNFIDNGYKMISDSNGIELYKDNKLIDKIKYKITIKIV